MPNYIIQVSEDAIMEMSLATLEAYVVPQRQKSKSKTNGLVTELETYGLLWGHKIILPDRDILFSVNKLTVDAMAYRSNGYVRPSEGLKVIKDMVTSYWPRYSFIGDFHSHPYDHYKTVNEISGYEFSDGDRESMIEKKSSDKEYRIALVMTIAALGRANNTTPKNIKGTDNIIFWTFNNYRFWLNACLVKEDNVIIPNSPHWKVKSNVLSRVYLYCPYLQGPWQVTEFGRRIAQGNHAPGAV